ncbi:MAG: GTP pyrophosphokinase [Deltaproteobacteria bacterium CG11_big_fil_rev_8_21_14_0_20_49_13]|nr:MAG: GTP pyrophosphokinase [Deltaproteobacteria bacterium CG11_big_fil_rev_8_21_14_0_20_49_13]
MLRLNDILDTVSAYNSGADLDSIKKAYVFAAKVHQGQTRRSGEPYLIHPLETAGVLAEMRLDVPSIVTALLHDTVEDTVTTLEEIEQLFGEEVRNLVDGVTKLSKIKFTTSEEKQAENFRKMIMAMAKDIRVILIKLADRLHNMRTLEFMPEGKRVEIAKETMDIYAPIANRLGIQKIKTELEDLSFKYMNPEIYKVIDEKIVERKSKREKYIDDVLDFVKKKMADNSVKCEISGRIKHYYSIHRKMEAQNIPFDEVYDIIAFRIVVDSLPQCYEALGVLHGMWRPVPGRFKDYIAMPKGNNYQSLHTTVIGPHGERIEFQIRTREMHDVAERGIAAHWKYKEGRIFDEKDEMKFKWIRRLLEWQKELSDPAEFLDTVKLDLFSEDVYVFTPKGALMELPRGSTPVDFAYSVHSDVGNNCIGAKVSGKIVPLKYALRSGDTVEVITQKGRKPNKDWLQFVKTSKAKAKIRQYIRQEEHEHGVDIGKEIFEKECAKHGLSSSRILKSDEMEKYLREMHIKEPASMFVSIGYGRLSAHQVILHLVPKEQLNLPETQKKETIWQKVVGKITKRQKGLVKVGGLSDVLVTYGKCCNPVPGDSIIGYVTHGKGVSVHIRDCQKMLSADPERLVQVEWDSSSETSRIAKIRVICVDRQGILANMTEAITEEGVNITQAEVRTMEDKKAINVFDIEIKNTDELRSVIHALEKLKGVISVERMRT